MSELKDFLLDESKLKEVAEAIIEPISKTIATNIQKGASIKFKNFICHTVGKLPEYKGAQYVNSLGSFEGKIAGPFYILFPTGEALNVAGTMMMMTGDELLNFINKGYDAESEDAFKEVMSQVTGQVSTVLRNMFKEVNGTISSTKDINILEDLKDYEADLEGDESVLICYQMTFEGEDPFLFYFALSKELAFSIAPLEGAEEAAVNKAEAESLSSEESVSEEEIARNVEAIRKIRVPMVVSLAQKKITVEEILKQICVGSIIEFNVAFDSYLDLYANNCKIGEGEVVTVNEFYGLQIKSVLSPRETLETIL